MNIYGTHPTNKKSLQTILPQNVYTIWKVTPGPASNPYMEAFLESQKVLEQQQQEQQQLQETFL